MGLIRSPLTTRERTSPPANCVGGGLVPSSKAAPRTTAAISAAMSSLELWDDGEVNGVAYIKCQGADSRMIYTWKPETFVYKWLFHVVSIGCLGYQVYIMLSCKFEMDMN